VISGAPRHGIGRPPHCRSSDPSRRSEAACAAHHPTFPSPTVAHQLARIRRTSGGTSQGTPSAVLRPVMRDTCPPGDLRSANARIAAARLLGPTWLTLVRKSAAWVYVLTRRLGERVTSAQETADAARAAAESTDRCGRSGRLTRRDSGPHATWGHPCGFGSRSKSPAPRLSSRFMTHGVMPATALA
jgi:hypothetical protein